jgi:hypothetical protein
VCSRALYEICRVIAFHFCRGCGSARLLWGSELLSQEGFQIEIGFGKVEVKLYLHFQHFKVDVYVSAYSDKAYNKKGPREVDWLESRHHL